MSVLKSLGLPLFSMSNDVNKVFLALFSIFLALFLALFSTKTIPKFL